MNTQLLLINEADSTLLIKNHSPYFIDISIANTTSFQIYNVITYLFIFFSKHFLYIIQSAPYCTIPVPENTLVYQGYKDEQEIFILKSVTVILHRNI